MIKIRDVKTGRDYLFYTRFQADIFCDGFDRPYDLVGVDVK